MLSHLISILKNHASEMFLWFDFVFMKYFTIRGSFVYAKLFKVSKFNPAYFLRPTNDFYDFT